MHFDEMWLQHIYNNYICMSLQFPNGWNFHSREPDGLGGIFIQTEHL